MSDSPPITIDIWSDVACPWCYIGKRHLEAGIAAFAEDHDEPVDVTFHSFELSPDTPVDFAGDEIDFLVGHKGIDEASARRMLERVTGIAADAGLDYDFGHLQHTNTIKAHQVLHLAREHGVQPEMKERLLRAYFVEGRHIGRDADLADLASDVGLDRDEVLAALAEDRYLAAVRADQRTAMELGVRGVPFFVIDGRYGVSGAQAAEVFADVLGRAVADREVAAGAGGVAPSHP